MIFIYYRTFRKGCHNNGQRTAAQGKDGERVPKGQQKSQGSMASRRNAGAQRHGGVLAPVKARRAGVRVLWNNRADAPRNVRAFQDGAAVA